jgi:myosin-5
MSFSFSRLSRSSSRKDVDEPVEQRKSFARLPSFTLRGSRAAEKSPASTPVKSPSAKKSPAPAPVESRERGDSLVGSQVWVPDKTNLYYKAELVAVNGGQATISVNGVSSTVTVFYPYDERDKSCDDLVQMLNVDQPNMLHTLAARHHLGENPYTNVGQESILISFNPFKWIDGLYTDELMREHYQMLADKELKPHVYAIAAQAYRALCRTATSQSIVTSGESGSGKTENTKQVFRFLAEIAGASVAPDGAAIEQVGMEQILLNSNPVLEAFGNAKTSRNDNSSRFGKLVKVHFDGWGRIVGSNTRNYLLEKSRVTSPESGERSYHVFYMMLNGLTEAELQVRELRPVSGSGLGYPEALGRTGCVAVDGRDDAKEWREMVAAMNNLGIGAEEHDQIFDVTAAVMHLTRVRFADAGGDNEAKVLDPAPLHAVANLLQACNPLNLISIA